MDMQYVEQLNAALEGTLAPNTQTIKQATKVLNEQFYKSPKCVPALYQILHSSSSTQIQQLAAVELRKRVGQGKTKFWAKTQVSMRTEIKTGLLQMLAAGGALPPLVRHSISRLIAAIAKRDLPDGQWPELLGWLWTAASNSDAAVREIGLYTLYCILDTIVMEDFTEQLPQLLGLFQKTLNDPENLGIRIITLRALGKIAEYISAEDKDQVAAVQSLVPNMVQVLGQALEAGDVDGIKHGFDVLETLLYIDVPYLTPHLTELVQFQLMAAANKDYGEDARIMALNSLVWLIKFKKGKVQSLGLSQTIIEGLLPIGAEEEDEDDDEGDSPAKVSFKCLDALATNLPPTHVFPPLFTLFQQYCQSPNPHMRKSAIMAFGVTVEGVSFYIQPHLDQLWPFLESALADPELVVRNAACKALMCLTDMLAEDCAKRHETVLPLLSNLINDVGTQRYAMVALDAYLECMGETIVQYLPTLMDRLIQLLDHAPDKLKSIAVGAIGSSAHAAKQQFQPYFEATMTRILPFLELVPEDGETGEQGTKTDLRGVAQDTVGTLAEAVGKEAFRPYYQPTMELAFKATALNNPRLKECSFIYFAVMTKVYGEEFAPLLPTVMPLLIASLGQAEIGDDDEEKTLALTENGFTSKPGEDDNADDSDDFVDIEDLDEEDLDFSAGSAIAVEKEVAADALLEVFRNTKSHFLPYIEAVVEALRNMLSHFWDGIRKSAATTLLSYIVTFHDLVVTEKWTPGIHPKPLPANLQQLINEILPPIVEMWQDEEDRDVVNSLCEDFQVLVDKVGPAAIVPDHLDTICHLVLQLLERKAPCQLDTDEEEDELPVGEKPEEQSEYDALLICSACDLVASLAKCLGPDFGQAFGQFYPEMAKFYNPARTATERATAIGSLAEVTEAMGEAITSYTPQLLQLAQAALGDEDPEVQSNAAYFIGTLTSASSQDLSGQYGPIFASLQNLFALKIDKKETFRARDNACGAIARMILKNRAAVPVDQVLPPVIAALPLTQDFEPYTPLFECFFRLAGENDATLANNLDGLLPVFSKVLQDQTTAKDEISQPLAVSTYNRLLELTRALPADRVQAAGLSQYI